VEGGKQKKKEESRRPSQCTKHTRQTKKKMAENGTTDAVAHPSLPMDASSSSMPAYILVLVIALEVLVVMGVCWICFRVFTAISRESRQPHCADVISEATTSAIKSSNKVTTHRSMSGQICVVCGDEPGAYAGVKGLVCGDCVAVCAECEYKVYVPAVEDGNVLPLHPNCIPATYVHRFSQT
jgi:hypothetical protein